ncbi:MAG: hypothetical protein KDD85_10040 [Parvularculaceae bacterium]|nr:hypothetical protein [Parvularculaceae bacterium]
MDGAQTIARAGVFSASVSARTLALLFALAVFAGWIAAPGGLFTVDEYFYLRMAEAFANEGALTFRQFDVAGAPALDFSFGNPAPPAGRLMAQYPAGYAIIAAPFYFCFGVKGLSLLNALSAFAALALTYKIARRASGDKGAALAAVAILASATFWSSYIFVIWPHMLALAIVLGVIALALKAGEGDSRAAIAAGLLIGAGESVRIDMIALAPAIIVWLRLFCDGKTRRLSLLVAGATLVGLALPVALNWIRSGAFELISYDNDVAANDVSAFAPLAIFGAAAFIGVLSFDCRSIFPLRKKTMIALGAIAALLCIAAPATVYGAAHGFWYSLVDAQAYAHLGRQFNIERTEWGWISFYGLSKKALLQCIPFAVLVFFPIRRLLGGEALRCEALLIVTSAAFATLYSFNETDSGVGLNSRFLLPLLPAISILAAIELRAMIARGDARLASVKTAALTGAGAFLLLRVALDAGEPWRTPIDIYPQLALAGALLAAIALNAIRPSRQAARASALLAGAAFGAAAALGAADLFEEQGFRAYSAEQARLYRAAVPADALVFSTRPKLFAVAAGDGLSLAYPGLNAAEKEKAVIEAYRAAGRCVYAQGEKGLEWAGETGLFAPPVALRAEFSQGGLAPLRDNPKSCP